MAACEHACSPQHVPCGLSVRSFPSWCRSHLQRTCQRSTARLARCRCSAADGAQREHSERLWLELSCGCALAQRECGSRASMRTYHRRLLQLLRRVRGAVRLSRPVLMTPLRFAAAAGAPGSAGAGVCSGGVWKEASLSALEAGTELPSVRGAACMLRPADWCCDWKLTGCTTASMLA